MCRPYLVRSFKKISLNTDVKVGGNSEGSLRLRRLRCVDHTDISLNTTVQVEYPFMKLQDSGA